MLYNCIYEYSCSIHRFKSRIKKNGEALYIAVDTALGSNTEHRCRICRPTTCEIADHGYCMTIVIPKHRPDGYGGGYERMKGTHLEKKRKNSTVYDLEHRLDIGFDPLQPQSANHQQGSNHRIGGIGRDHHGQWLSGIGGGNGILVPAMPAGTTHTGQTV
jgi:hypothetical protein